MLRKNFFDFYENNAVPINCPSERTIINSESAYLINCIFKNFINSENGGCLFFSSIVISSLIELCSFSNCYSNENGGSIYFYSIGSFISNKNCFLNCSANINGLSIFNSINSDSKIEIHLTTMIYCISITGSCPLYIIYGNQKINQFNSTNNKASCYSGFCVDGCNKFIGSFYNIYNNSALLYVCTYFRSNINVDYSYNSNIIKNNSPSSYSIVFTWSGNFNLTNCIFTNNINLLFGFNSGSLKISNSYIDHQPDLMGNSIIYNYPNSFIYTPSIKINLYDCIEIFSKNNFKNQKLIKKIIFIINIIN